MTALQNLLPPHIHSSPREKYYHWRLPLIAFFLLVMLGGNILLRAIAPSPFADKQSFLSLWLLSFIPYLLCCIVILTTKPQQGHWQWIEMGILLLGAFLLRGILLPVEPDLSHDAWRYLWDARVTLHGYSPYAYAPDSSPLIPLHDQLIYMHVDYHAVPSLYPPLAQAIYLLSYLLAPDNLPVLKTIFLCFDLATCVILAVTLKKRELDPARCVIYVWCPLPIVEFAVQGHIDAVVLPLLLLIILCTQSEQKRMRILTGVLLGLATLTKIYPILLLFVVMRRRDYALPVACTLTVAVGYLPYLILGHGQILGFFSTYIGLHGGNEGPVLLALRWLGDILHLSDIIRLWMERIVDLLIVITLCCGVFLLRQQRKISIEAAMLISIGTIFSLSSFVYPWYTTALLVWLPFLSEPLTVGKYWKWKTLTGKKLAILAPWYFCCASVCAYFFLGKSDWRIYYVLVDAVPCVILGAAMVVGRMQHRIQSD